MSSQLIQTGSGANDPHYCDKIEQVKPNLVLSHTTRLGGTVLDQTGAPFQNSPVELRLYVSESKQTVIAKVSTDKEGHFDLGAVHAGSYRLLASPTRTFRQAEKLECFDRDPCTLRVTLQANPTDQPGMFCPVK